MIGLNYFQFHRRDKGGGYGEGAGEFHQDSAGFAYSYYFAFYSFEGAFLDDDLLSFAELGADFREVDQVRVKGRGYCNEVFHCFCRDCQRSVCGAVPVVVDRAGFTEAADVGVEGFSCGLGEDQAGYGWD